MKKKDIPASSEDPYTWEIARIKREGELNALRAAIESIKRHITNSAWSNTEHGGKYKGLGVAMTKVEHKLKEMRMLLAEVKEIDPNND